MSLIGDIPVDPDQDTAQQWAKDELAKKVYQDGGSSWLRDLWNKIIDLLTYRPSSGTGSGLANFPVGLVVTIALMVILVGGIVAVIVYGSRGRRKAAASSSVFDDDARDIASLRDAAASAAERGEWTLAYVERFRAIVRRAEDRGWIAIVPGMTAYEFAQEAATKITGFAVELEWAGELFDEIRYGHTRGTAGSYQRLTALERALSSSKVEVSAS